LLQAQYLKPFATGIWGSVFAGGHVIFGLVYWAGILAHFL